MENIDQIYILGSGTSTGVPTLGCDCQVCLSNDKKNKRLRSSIVIRSKNGKFILIDTSPDLRTQLLRSKIKMIDAAIITHEHADHTHGIDDLRPFCFYRKEPIPIYTYDKCADILTEKFPYIFQREKVFQSKKILGGGIPKLDLHPLNQMKQNILDLEFEFFLLPHGHTKTLGFTVDKMAYIIDCHHVPKDVISKLKSKNLDLLIIDCLRTKKHQTHLHLEKSLEYAQQINAKQTGLIHMSHEFDHNTFTKQLVDKGHTSIFPLYDQQVLTY